MPPLSLIVPVYNEAENFPRLLAEIEKHIPPPFTMYVVYDFDADTTVPVAEEYADAIKKQYHIKLHPQMAGSLYVRPWLSA